MHETHTDDDVASLKRENFPATQGVHVDDHEREYVPALHGLHKTDASDPLHAPDAAEYLPAEHSPEHVRLVAPSEVSVEYFPASQPIQALDPVILV